MRSFGPIWIRISDPRSLGLWCIKEADEAVTIVSVPLMYRGPDNAKGTLPKV